MNDLNGRIVADSCTGLPYPSYGTATDELNVRLTRRVHELEDRLSELEAENAKLREKCMTNMERIQTADIDALATYLWEISQSIYGVDFGDGVENELDFAFDAARDNNNPSAIKRWLERTEWH